jgi:streptogramin lyase
VGCEGLERPKLFWCWNCKNQGVNLYIVRIKRVFELVLTGCLITSGLTLTPGAQGATRVFATLAAGSGALQLTLDSSENVYVTNYANDTVNKIDSSGNIVWTVLTGSGSGPRAITTDQFGNILVTLFGKGKIAKISPDGNTVNTDFATTGGNPHGIARDSSGNIYASDTTNNRVTKFSVSGGAAIATYSTGTQPRDITIDSAGNIYTSNFASNSVTKITSAGVITTSYATTGANPWGITVDSSGNVYTANFGAGTITKIFPNGTVITSFANISPVSQPVDIVLDPDGNLYAAGSDKLARVSQSNLSAISAATVTDLGSVSTGINGMTIDSRGNIYTTSYQASAANAVYKIDNASSQAFSLSSSTESVILGSPIIGYNVNTSALAMSGFSISPAISNGLSFSTSTGRITGTPLAAASAVTYTILGNSESIWQSRTFSLTVTPALAAPAFTLSSSSESRTVNTAATGFTITSTGGAIASFSINATPPGMSLNSTTGALTGTPNTVASVTTYTITATNASGSTTQTFALTVTAAPVNNSASQEAAQAEVARKAKEQRELTEILALIPKIGELTLSLGETTKSLYSTKCVKGKTTKYVNKGSKCPKGYVKK